MAIYRTKRKKITDALVEKLKEIDGSHPYNINLFQNVKANMVFLDEIEQYPKVCVIAGDETREYLPDNYKWRFLTLSIRAYVKNEDDAQEELALLFEDIENVLDNSDAMVYDDSVSPSQAITQLTVLNLSTDEGVIKPLGIGEMAIEVRY
tara:strand:- start:7741 stop:8190 length:450 start_codon:yes stop_codon:yes gene_type:complete